MSQKLKETIDRLVEDAIRRILPQVMNEVLLRTIAGSGVIRESRPAPKSPPVTAGKRVQDTPRKARRGRPDLSQVLDESAGSEFYSQFAPVPEPAYEEPEAPSPRAEVVRQNIRGLPPEIQAMAEGMDLDVDEGEMWETEEATTVAPRGDDVGDLGTSSRRVGADFSRMVQTIRLTEQRKPAADAADIAAKRQFEELRLKRHRERLNGGKPLE